MMAYMTATTKKAPRQLQASDSRPPSSGPRIMPKTDTPEKRARACWRWASGTLSLIQARPSGKMPAAVAPMAARASTSAVRLVAAAAARVMAVQASAAIAITRSLPWRSPTGPQSNWVTA